MSEDSARQLTNAPVADLAAGPRECGGQNLTLRYRDGEKKVFVPPNAPVVSLKAGKADENALLVPSAKVMITAQERPASQPRCA